MEDTQLVKIKRMAVAAFIVIAAGMVLYFLLFNTEVILGWISSLTGVLSPIICGFVIAYILNSPMRFIENLILKVYAKRKKKPGPKALRSIRLMSSLTTIILLVLMAYAVIALVLPELARSIQNILANVSTYSQNLQNWYGEFVKEYALDASTQEIFTNALAAGQKWISEQFSPQFNGFLGKVTSSVLVMFVMFKNLLLGLFVSIYVLMAQDSIVARFRRGLYAFMNAATANRTLKNLRFVDEKFGGFLIGKIIDSAIIGVICYIVLALLQMPFALLVATVVGLTNIIPFFGPFLGAIPSAILIGCESPEKALYFLIFVVILQQVDGNLLGPKILGNSVGVSSMMVLVAILVGGGLFGFVGMVVGVPVCAILTSVIQSVILQRVVRKNLPGDIEAYHHMDYFDPIKREIVPQKKFDKTVSLYKRIRQRSEDISEFYIPLKDHPWDRTVEDVERERLQYKAEWEADSQFTRDRSVQIDAISNELIKKLDQADFSVSEELSKTNMLAASVDDESDSIELNIEPAIAPANELAIEPDNQVEESGQMTSDAAELEAQKVAVEAQGEVPKADA